METAEELKILRRDLARWHRRGLHQPDELAQIVPARVNHAPFGVVYADFFTGTNAAA